MRSAGHSLHITELFSVAVFEDTVEKMPKSKLDFDFRPSVPHFRVFAPPFKHLFKPKEQFYVELLHTYIMSIAAAPPIPSV